MTGYFAQDSWFGWSKTLTGFCDLAAELGCDGDAILARHGLDRPTLEGPGFPVPTISLFGALAELARQTEEPGVAIRLLRLQTYDVLGALGQVARRSRNLGKALDAFSMNIHARGTGYVPSLERSVDTVIVRYRSMLAPGPSQDLQLDYNIGSTVMTIRSLIGPDWSPELVELARPRPSRTTEWNAYFGCPIRFDAEECMVLFDASDLSRPLTLSDARQAAGTAQIDAEGCVPINFVQIVDREIIRSLSRGIADLSVISDALGISSRTLQRRLVEAGTSYQDRLDGIRKVWAQQHLASGQISLTDLSQMLGFGDLSTFSARFKSWFGVSPRGWRKALGGPLSQ